MLIFFVQKAKNIVSSGDNICPRLRLSDYPHDFLNLGYLVQIQTVLIMLSLTIEKLTTGYQLDKRWYLPLRLSGRHFLSTIDFPICLGFFLSQLWAGLYHLVYGVRYSKQGLEGVNHGSWEHPIRDSTMVFDLQIWALWDQLRLYLRTTSQRQWPG